MDLNRLTRDADDLIRKVVSRYNQLYVPAGTISQLELDLMLDDLRKLYDTFKNIGQLNLNFQNSSVRPEVQVNTAVPTSPGYAIPASTDISENPANSPQPTQQAPVQQHQEPELIAEAKPEPQFEKETEINLPVETVEEAITQSEYDPEPISENEAQASPEITKPVEESSQNSRPVTPEPAAGMLADKFNSGNKSLSETMAASQAQGIMGARILFQPISDLNTGIGLNDKFSFISDLFANSSAQYDEAISRINKAVNLDEANWILQKYHSSEWDHKHESLARLKDFVKRRFI